MNSESGLLELIGLIYDAAEDASGWPRLLRAIGEALNGVSCGLAADDRRGGRTRMHESHGLDPHYLNQYGTYYGTIDAWVAAGWPHYVAGEVFPSHRSITDETLRESEFYNDFLRHQNLFYAMPGIIAKSDGLTAIITLMRSASTGPFVAADEAMLRTLLPHLQRAIRIHQHLNVAGRSVRALDSVAIGLLLVTSSGKLVFANLYARQILNQDDGISLNKKGVLATRLHDSSLLAECARTAATSQGKGMHAGSAFTVERPSGKRPYCVQASPIRFPESVLGHENPAVVLFISDPEQSNDTNPEILERLFRLTPAEAGVAAALMRGGGLNSVCEELSIRPNTGRAHLRSLFSKLGVKRQAELVALLLRAVGPGYGESRSI
jgi:DNA-binding CsgD family transcriptional regulator